MLHSKKKKKLKKQLQKKTEEMTRMKAEQQDKEERSLQTLQEENVKHKKIVDDLLSKLNTQSDCFIQIQAQLSESESEVQSLRTRYERLKANCIINTSSYTEWNHDNVSDWMLSLDNGAYEKYETVLRRQLAEVDMNGVDLVKCTMEDLKGFGVEHNGHQAAITKYIETLDGQVKKEPLFMLNKESKALDIKEKAVNVKLQVGKIVKVAVIAAAGAATGGIGAAMCLVDALRGVELEMSFSESEEQKEITKHRSDNNRYLFLHIVYSSKKTKRSGLGLKKTTLQVKGNIYVTYMEGLNELAKRKLQELTTENADAAIDFIRNTIRYEK